MTVAKVATTMEGCKLQVLKQIQVPKVYSASLSARSIHSGHHALNELSTKYSHENSYYTSIANANLATDDEDTTQSPIFNYQQQFEDDEDQPVKTPGQNFIYIQSLADKAVHKVFLSAEDERDTQKLFLLPHFCYKLSATYISGASEVLVGLTQNMRLYLNDKLFSNECTSFFLSQTFLVFVNSTSGLSHELFIYDTNRALPKPISGNATEAPKLASLQDDSNFNVRAVERGSRIVTINGTRTILQMPRGNLEGIYPRFIMLKQLIEDIEAAEYGKVFRLLRQHKIDINLIYDVNPDKFMANIGKFVAEVKQVDYLNLFINSLSEDERGKELEFMRPQDEEDLIKKSHSEFLLTEIYGGETAPASSVSPKINRICEALKEELWKLNGE